MELTFKLFDGPKKFDVPEAVLFLIFKSPYWEVLHLTRLRWNSGHLVQCNDCFPLYVACVVCELLNFLDHHFRPQNILSMVGTHCCDVGRRLFSTPLQRIPINNKIC